MKQLIVAYSDYMIAGDLGTYEDKENLSNENNELLRTNLLSMDTDIIEIKEVDISQDQQNLTKKETVTEEMSKMLGEDQKATKLIEVKFHPELKDRWQRWMQEGLPKENKKVILETYPRKESRYRGSSSEFRINACLNGNCC